MSTNEDAECHVYVICHQINGVMAGPVKVGMASNPAGRLNELQTGNPHELVLAAQFRIPARWIARQVEEGFHHTQAKKRLRGEWFDFSPREAVFLMCLLLDIALKERAHLSPEDHEHALELTGVKAALADVRFHVKPETLQ